MYLCLAHIWLVYNFPTASEEVSNWEHGEIPLILGSALGRGERRFFTQAKSQVKVVMDLEAGTPGFGWKKGSPSSLAIASLNICLF